MSERMYFCGACRRSFMGPARHGDDYPRCPYSDCRAAKQNIWDSMDQCDRDWEIRQQRARENAERVARNATTTSGLAPVVARGASPAKGSGGLGLGCGSILGGLVLMSIIAAIGECADHERRTSTGVAERPPPAKRPEFTTLVVECNIRAEPSEHGEKLGTAPLGATLPILDIRGKWRQIRYRETIGWIGPVCRDDEQ